MQPPARHKVLKKHSAAMKGVRNGIHTGYLWPGEAKTITAATNREDFVPYLTWIGKEEDA